RSGAPVARGHGVLVVEFAVAKKNAMMVLDRTTSCLFCEDELSASLHQDAALALTDPVALVTRSSWTVKLTVEGVCTGTITSIKGDASRYATRTLILVESASAPYR